MCLHGMEAALELEGARPLCRVPGLSQRWSVSCKTSMLFIFSLLHCIPKKQPASDLLENLHLL